MTKSDKNTYSYTLAAVPAVMGGGEKWLMN